MRRLSASQCSDWINHVSLAPPPGAFPWEEICYEACCMQVCSFCVSSFYWFVLELVLWARAVHLHIALILWGRFSQFSCSEITCKPFSWLLLSCCQQLFLDTRSIVYAWPEVHALGLLFLVRLKVVMLDNCPCTGKRLGSCCCISKRGSCQTPIHRSVTTNVWSSNLPSYIMILWDVMFSLFWPWMLLSIAIEIKHHMVSTTSWRRQGVDSLRGGVACLWNVMV